MPTYKCTDNSRVTQAQIDRKIRKGKIQLLTNCMETYGYIFCQRCRKNDCKPLDCSHNKSVQDCKNEGKTELCWDVSNMELIGRICQQKKDKLNLQYGRNKWKNKLF